MKRALLLLLILGVCLAGVALSLILLPGTGEQLALRLDKAWQAGRLEVSEPRMLDVDTVGFDSVQVRSTRPAPADRRSALELSDVEWQRGTLLSLGRDLDVQRSRVRFDTGTFTLAFTGRWGESPIWPGLDDRDDWPERLPADVRGNRLEVAVRGGAADDAIELSTTAVDPRLQRSAGGGGVLTADLESDLWEAASLEWRFRTSRSGFRLHLDDADLARVPFVKLARIFRFPWPVDMPPIAGRADLDWTVQGGRPTLEVQHYQVDLGLSDLPHRLHYLTGAATVTPEQVSWKISSGRYSQSRLTAAIEIDRASRRVTGSAAVQDVLGDRAIGAGLPKPWYELLQRIPLAGRCDMEVALAGFVGLRARDVVEELTLRFQGVGLRNSRGGGAVTSGLAGEFTLRPITGGWELTGNSSASRVHGFHLPASRWKGSIDERGLRLERSDETGARVTLECHLEEGNRPTFSLYLEDFPLSSWLDRDLGGARGSIYVSGSWDLNRGFSLDGWCNWSGLEVPDSVTWPFRRPAGEVSGQLLFRRHRGQDYLPSIAVQDAVGTWVAHGWIDPKRQWTLSGVAAEFSSRLPTPLEIPSLVEDPREGWHRFRLEGALLDWRSP